MRPFIRIQMTYRDVGIDVTWDESNRFEQEYRRRQNMICMFGFMRDTLDYCKREQIQLAVLTNGNSKGQRKKAAVLGLDRWFEADRIFVTGEIGWHVIWLNHRKRPCPSVQNLPENELEDGKELPGLIRQKRIEE